MIRLINLKLELVLVETELLELTALEMLSTRQFALLPIPDSLNGLNGQCAAPRAALELL